MTTHEYADKKGWTLHETGGELRMECPFCHDRENSFSINAATGAWHCFRGSCDERGKSLFSLKRRLGDAPSYTDVSAKKSYTAPSVELAPVSEAMYVWFEEERKLPRSIVDLYGIKRRGPDLAFPFTLKGEVVNVQYRKIPKGGFPHEKDCRPILWGMDQVKPRKELAITEGMIDAMVAYHWGHDAVVSMPQGTNNLDWINECWDWLERFDSYFLMTDEDDPGEKAAIEIARRLPNCRRVRLGHKDANDALRAGMTSKEFLVRYSEAEYMDLHLLKAAETYEEAMLAPKAPGRPTPWPMINAAFSRGGVQVPSVNVIAGPNGSGKSTALLEVVLYDLEGPDPMVAVVSSNELPVIVSLEKMVKQSGRIPGRSSNRDFFEHSVRHNLHMLDLVDIVDENTLFEMFDIGAKRHGARLFVIDSISRLNMPNGGEDSNEREKKFINRCLQFTRRYDAVMWIVSHLRKPKYDDEEFGKVDVKGSGSLTDLADNVFGYQRTSLKKQKKLEDEGEVVYHARLRILKNRDTGKEWGARLAYDYTWDRLTQIERNNKESET